MGDFKYSLTWDAYNKNICKGLSSLQQHGEFVDMTLAADGHHVKVHKMVMSLASPYIKDLITSADCPHPVIFLNQISYETLSSILEYVYTGHVLVAKHNLSQFVDACKALHINGFEEMESTHNSDAKLSNLEKQNTNILYDDNMHDYSDFVEDEIQENESKPDLNIEYIDDRELDCPKSTEEMKPVHQHSVKKPVIQYSLSNHGNLQLVLNRFVYNLRYCSRKSGQRRWQCVDGVCKELKCPARLTTVRNAVMVRNNSHNHPYHDKKILKKVEAGTIFTALDEAMNQIHLIRRVKVEKTIEDAS